MVLAVFWVLLIALLTLPMLAVVHRFVLRGEVILGSISLFRPEALQVAVLLGVL